MRLLLFDRSVLNWINPWMGLRHVKYLFGRTAKQLAAAALPLTLAPSLLPWNAEAVARPGNFFFWYPKGSYALGIFKMKHFECFIWRRQRGPKWWNQRDFRAFSGCWCLLDESP